MNVVKYARLEAGYSQLQLCKIVKTSPKKLVSIERGKTDNVTKGLMIKISKALNRPIKELFFDEIEEGVIYGEKG